MRRALSSMSCLFPFVFTAVPLVSQSPAQKPAKEAQKKEAQKKEPQDEEAGTPDGGQEAGEKAARRPTGDTVPYVEFLDKKYNSPEKEGALPSIWIKFNLAPEVPKGAKIYFELEYNALTLEEVEYALKDENRRNLAFTWAPKQRLAVGEYFFRTRMPLRDQAPAVQKALKENKKRFPPENEPWSCYYPKESLQVGGAIEEAAEKKAICESYSRFIEKLINNMDEFKEKMDKVNDGQELVNGNTLDVEKFKAFIIGWRKKQGEVQKEILDFQVKEPALFQNSITAFANLRELGQMVSKRSYQIQKEVTTKYKVEEINPKETHQYFDRATRFKADVDGLKRKMDNVLRLTCPEEEASDSSEEGDADGEGKKKAVEGKGEEGEAAPPEDKPSENGKQGKKAPAKGEKADKTEKKTSGKK